MIRRASLATTPSICWIALAALAAPLASAAEDDRGQPTPLPPGVKPLQSPGIHNLFALGTNGFSGSTPEGEAGFAALAALGVKTIVSVDGARPDVETARRHGLRYVHLPHGYDGISPKVQFQLAQAGHLLPGPIYVHCHHGKHRGPAAAAILCLANQGWSKAQAEAYLHAAGTATNYAGLYEVVRNYRAPSPADLKRPPVEFPEVARVSGLVESMVAIDGHWELLKAVRDAGYRTPPNQPDVQPANQAVILWEHYREAQRLPESTRLGGDIIDRFNQAEAEGKEAERLLRQFAEDPEPDARAALDQVFNRMARSCAACHKAHRDAAGIRPKP